MKPPWSTNQLKRLGDALRDDATIPTSLPDYAEVIAWYDDLAASVHSRIASLGLEGIAGVSAVQVTSRAKTIETLRDKLQREWPIRLPSIQDVAGVRVVADMSLRRQDEVVKAIVAEFGHSPDAVHDLRQEPHAGYRAVHIWLRLDEGRAEVQVRTPVQNEWANAYEALADLAGRGIRYGSDPDWVPGTPEVLILMGKPGPFRDFPEALRYMSESQLRTVETLRTLTEIWRDLPTSKDPRLLDEILDLLRVEWAKHPMLRDEPLVIGFGAGDDAAVVGVSLLLHELETANLKMLGLLREQLEQHRNEIGRNST